MDSPPDRTRLIVPPCPLCQTQEGRAQSVTAGTHQRTVQYVCEHCTHTWEITTEAPPELLFARRSA
jgi:transposase-like protein